MPAKAHKVRIGKSWYTLRYGNKALRRYEEVAKATVADLGGTTFGVGTITYLLYAGMVYEHPYVTLDDVDEMLDTYLEAGHDITKIVSVVTEALSESGWFQVSPTEASASTKDSGETPAEQA